MTRSKSPGRRRPTVHVTLGRASRLHRLVAVLAQGPRSREALLSLLQIGLRTFYRELELLRRCGVKVRLDAKAYLLLTTAQEAEGRLPFPDPQLSFAEMAELAAGPGEAAKRLADLLDQVVNHSTPPKKSRKAKAQGGGGGRAKGRAGKAGE